MRAFRIPAGIANDGSIVGEPLGVIVEWESSHADKLHQIYINGKFAGKTHNTLDRKIMLPHRMGFKGVISVQVFAVEIEDAACDFSGDLEGVADFGRIQISFAKLMSLPFDGSVNIYSNNGSGDIDTSEAVNSKPIRLWSNRLGKPGFGICCFGKSDFGYDGSAAPGFGVGVFGEGDFGFDSELFVWESDELESGKYLYGITVQDRFGVCSEGIIVSEEIVLISGATPAEKLEIVSYDAVSNTLVMSVD